MWIERLARLGYAAKGIVYAIVGVLAVQAAFGQGGRTTDTQGALTTIASQPFGKFLLALVAVGLVGYSLWRFVEAWADPDNKGSDAKGLATRFGYAISGLIYAGLAFSAIGLILGTGGGGGGDNTQQDWTAKVLAQPFGQWLIGLLGALIIGIGFYQFYKAYSAKFRKEWKLREMSSQEDTWATRIGRFGLAARGVVFVMTGFFLIQAARQSDASEVRGLDGALQALAQQAYGKWLLAIVALGLVAYGLYMGVQARYRRISSH
ncbi:MAG: DUF1206 domain-containing protein [Kastovskya adunca ATA6-11-RM4]|jgi:hypothetical protein|nr:DUF1206 domain-containing protein [Kastovskya adunca ATA6-11-RM4]